MLNECHVFPDDFSVDDQEQQIITTLSDLLLSIGFSQDWIESFLTDLEEAKDNPAEDKLAGDLDQGNVLLNELGAFANKVLTDISKHATAIDKFVQAGVEQTQKENLELLKIRLEEMQDHADDQ